MDDIKDIDNYKPTGMVCRCIGDCEHIAYNTTCELLPRAKCFKKITIDEDGELVIRAGCLNSRDTHIDQCSKWAKYKFSEPTAFGCCNNETLCNDHLDLKIPVAPQSPFFTDSQRDVLIGGLVSLAFCFVLLLLVVIGFRIRLRRQEERRRKQIENENEHMGCLVLTSTTNTTTSHYKHGGRCNHKLCKVGRGGTSHKGKDDWPPLQCTSSGSGIPLLMQRTIANQIQVVKEIGRGRYGTVMLGTWREEKVALKIFNSINEDSWHRETEIYQTVLLRHENILGFIAADICGIDSVTKMYLITEYHERGSLYDYLVYHSVDIVEALKLTHSASCGLAHLHTEITGTKGKPGIAHRDVKTKNLLVKNNGQCCVADMGLAVRYSRIEDKVDMGQQYGRPPVHQQQGTKRYMAPEVLEQTYDYTSFDSYKSIDVYGFALVMWEVLNRIKIDGVANTYHLPFYDVVSPNPDFDEMRKVVAVAGIRPPVENRFANHPILSTYTQAMKESWSSKSESRLSMLRVRKTLSTLREKLTSNPVATQIDTRDIDKMATASVVVIEGSMSDHKSTSSASNTSSDVTAMLTL